MTDDLTYDLPECPDCGSIMTQERGGGFIYCWECGEMWNPDDDTPVNDPELYEEQLL